MDVLFIAPVPPPVAGHALIAKVFLDDLIVRHNVKLVNLNKENLKDGAVNFKRIVQVAKIFTDVWRKRHADVVYFTISESVAGNIKDLIIYLMCFKRLPKMYIHLHGGSIGRLLFDRHRLLFGLNKIFIKRVAGVIISGDSHRSIFESILPQSMIHIAANCAEDHLFLAEKKIREKFSDNKTVRVLFIGNFIEQKGYGEIVEAFFKLSDRSKDRVRIDFAGRFDADSKKQMFLDRISGVDQIRYHGVVDDAHKKSLFARAHALCLPTSYFEGQPISILEAYASGCVVITTGQRGIGDVFTDGENGFEVQEKSPDSIRSILESMIENSETLIEIAMRNRKIAGEKYTRSIYSARLCEIIERSGPAKTEGRMLLGPVSRA